jgi:hypothetical protein
MAVAMADRTLYRWVDDDGNVHYTDTLPPSQMSKGHSELSTGGVLLKTVPATKSLEEIEQEEALRRLRFEQARLIERQRSADRVLLSSFSSEEDLISVRDGKLASIDAMIQMTRNNIQRQREWLAATRADAADMERSGEPVPRHLGDSISEAERAIEDAYAVIAAREAQKKAIREQFDQDLRRFRQLRKLAASGSQPTIIPLRSVRHRIVPCDDDRECDRRWRRALAYLRDRLSGEIQSAGPNLMVVAPSAGGNELSLVLSRIADPRGDGASLFLDLRCRTSLRAETLCQAPELRKLMEAFPAVIAGRDKTGAPPR